MRTSRGFTLLELMIIVAIIAIVAAIAIPGLLSAQRAGNERNASASLKSVSNAEYDFRANDRDNDKVTNFWVLDIYCLYGLCPSVTTTTPPAPAVINMIKLIEPSVAGADGDVPAPQPVPGAMSCAATIGVLTTKSSYVYRMFQGYGSPATVYGQPGPIVAYGNAYNASKFGVVAFPTSYSMGRNLFILSEEGTIYKANPGTTYAATYQGGTSSTSGFSGVIGGAAFTDATAFPDTPGASGWGKLD